MLPIPQHLQKSLIELEEYYLRLREDYTTKVQLVKTQIFHIDSLLSSAFAPPPNLARSIEELQEYYRRIESELVAFELEIITNLSHVKALVGKPETSQALLQQAELEPEPVPTPAHSPELESIQQAVPLTFTLPNSHFIEVPIEPEPKPKLETPSILYSVDAFLKTLHFASRKALRTYTQNGGGIKIDDSDGIKILQITVTSSEIHKKLNPKINLYTDYFNKWIGGNGKIVVLLKPPVTKHTNTNTNINSAGDLLPEYQGVTLTSAIDKILRDNQGTILHIDFMVRALYGTMRRDDTNRVTKNLLQILNDGVNNGDWDVDPDNPNCYTINYLSIIE